jgi:hypothetical protein
MTDNGGMMYFLDMEYILLSLDKYLKDIGKMVYLLVKVK